MVLCTCLILGEIHALSCPQQAGYAASNSLTWPVLDVSCPVWPCLGVSLGPTCGQSEWNYGHQGLHFESRSAKRHRKTLISLHILLVAILSQITAIKGLISSQDQQKIIGINGSVCRCFTHACFHGRSMPYLARNRPDMPLRIRWHGLSLT